MHFSDLPCRSKGKQVLAGGYHVGEGARLLRCSRLQGVVCAVLRMIRPEHTIVHRKQLHSIDTIPYEGCSFGPIQPIDDNRLHLVVHPPVFNKPNIYKIQEVIDSIAQRSSVESSLLSEIVFTLRMLLPIHRDRTHLWLSISVVLHRDIEVTSPQSYSRSSECRVCVRGGHAQDRRSGTT